MSPFSLGVLGSARVDAAPLFDPTSIAGCNLWLRADSLSLANNDPVSTWPDESGNGYDATQGTSGARPTFRTAQQNGKPALTFDGGDWLVSACPAHQPAQTRVMVVHVSGTGTHAIWYGTQTLAAVANLHVYADNRVVHSWTSASEYPTSSSSLPNAYAVLVTRHSNTADTYGYRINGSAAGGGASALNIAGDGTSVIGAGSTTGSIPLVGGIAELLHYNSALSDFDVTDLEGYLMTKWAIT